MTKVDSEKTGHQYRAKQQSCQGTNLAALDLTISSHTLGLVPGPKGEVEGVTCVHGSRAHQRRKEADRALSHATPQQGKFPGKLGRGEGRAGQRGGLEHQHQEAPGSLVLRRQAGGKEEVGNH